MVQSLLSLPVANYVEKNLSSPVGLFFSFHFKKLRYYFYPIRCTHFKILLSELFKELILFYFRVVLDL